MLTTEHVPFISRKIIQLADYGDSLNRYILRLKKLSGYFDICGELEREVLRLSNCPPQKVKHNKNRRAR